MRLIRLRTTSLLGAALLLTALPVAAATPSPAVPASSAPIAGTLTASDLANLVDQMTLAEEIGMVNGTSDQAGVTCGPGATNLDRSASATCYGQVWGSPGVRRLGIPRLRITDGPAGIRLSFFETAMPAPVGLAATFDPASAALFGSTVGKDGRASNQDVWLAPMINQVVVPTGWPQLRDARRGPVPHGRAHSRDDRRRPARGLDHDAQALRRERLRERSQRNERPGRRAHADGG